MLALLPGTQVSARGLAWEVVHHEPAGEQKRLRLRCIQGDFRGMELDLLTPFEDVQPIVRELDPERAGRLQQWRLYHQAFLLEQALGPAAMLAVQPGRLEIAPFQLVPIMRALEMSRPRLLLADGVGLGKTIEAGLVLCELIARRRAHRILIVSPAGPLLNQWHEEMRTRFGLGLEAIRDWGSLQEKRRSLVLGANPFDHLAHCLISIDFAKQEKVLQDLESTTWDVVVVDEAHHCVRMGQVGDRDDSQRRRLAEVLAAKSDALLLLTATPHDGYDPHFASLVELLDPSLVDGRGALRGDAYRAHVVRRLREHVRDPETGEEVFKKRAVTPEPVAFDAASHPAFAGLERSLLELVAPHLRRAVRRRRYGDVLAFVSLLKRSVSTAAACRETLSRIAERYEEMARRGAEDREAREQRLRTLRDYRRRLERYGALSAEEEEDEQNLAAEDMAGELLSTTLEDVEAGIADAARAARRDRDRLARVDEVARGLRALVELAGKAVAEDPKLAALEEAIRAIRRDEPAANLLVYTEYTDSQDAVVTRLERAREHGRIEGEILAIRGADSETVRTRVTERFAAEDGLVLVSTDATAEGLNLHHRCHHLVHLELPYNPNRLEQRNGRIDRYGQKETPRVRYLFLRGTFEERILLRLVAKYERQRARLTFVPNTLGLLAGDASVATTRLLEGLAEEDGMLFKPAPAALALVEGERDDTGSPAYDELLAEIDRSLAGYERAARTHSWLAEHGSHAEARHVASAARAREAGERLSAVDLLDFVCAALESETAVATARAPDRTVALELPSAWSFGLDGLPGWDADAQTVRLSADPGVVRDSTGRPVGYLGRAHPLVRRALDRVRNLQLGAGDGYLDRRASAARSDRGEPTLLFTFLGTVQSGAGRELERVIAVEAGAGGILAVHHDPGAVLAASAPEHARPTAGLWKRCFADWGAERGREAKRAAAEAFAIIAGELVAAHRAELARERTSLASWLAVRAEEITGRAAPAQAGLFEAASAAGEAGAPRWQQLAAPEERLAAFANDPSNAGPVRSEAEGVLSLYRRRLADLDRRGRVEVLEPTTLGVLMLVPTGGKA